MPAAGRGEWLGGGGGIEAPPAADLDSSAAAPVRSQVAVESSGGGVKWKWSYVAVESRGGGIEWRQRHVAFFPERVPRG